MFIADSRIWGFSSACSDATYSVHSVKYIIDHTIVAFALCMVTTIYYMIVHIANHWIYISSILL